MNVVSSMLLFLGEKIYALGKLSTLSMPEPEPHKMSIITNRNHAQGGGGEPEVMTFSVPEEGYSSLGIDATGTIVPFALPLSVEHGGTGVDTAEKLVDAIPYGDYVVSMEKMLDDKWLVKKWKSGLVEMWSRQQVTWNSMSSTNAGGGIRGVTRIDLPIAEIDGTNCVTAVANGQKQGTWATANCDWEVAENKGRLELHAYRVSSQSTTPITLNVSIYVAAYIPPTSTQNE